MADSRDRDPSTMKTSNPDPTKPGDSEVDAWHRDTGTTPYREREHKDRPEWAYDEDGYCHSCGNGKRKHHAPWCELADLFELKSEALADALALGRPRHKSGLDQSSPETVPVGKVLDALVEVLCSQVFDSVNWVDLYFVLNEKVEQNPEIIERVTQRLQSLGLPVVNE